jgi:hypothetical protein
VSIFSVSAETPLATGNVKIAEDSIGISVSYSDFKDDDADIIEQNTDSFIIQNNNVEEIRVIIEATSLPSGYSAESKEMIIAGSSEVQTTLKINVSHSQDAGTENVGSIVLKGSSDSQLDSATLTQETASMLELSGLKVEYTDKEGKLETDSFNGDDEEFTLDKDIKPFTEMKLIFKVKNLLDSDYDIDLESIKITLESEDNDFFDSSFEEEYDLDSLSGEEKSEVEVNLMFDEDADAGSNTLKITLEGEDENGAEYEIERELYFDVSRENDDLRIIKLELNPETSTFCDKNLQLTLGIRNLGSNKQKFAAISIFNEALGIDEHVDQILIEEHNDNPDYWEETFTFDFNNKFKVGEYDIDINVYVDKDEPVSFKRHSLIINKCKVDVEKVPVNESENGSSKTEVITSTLDINENEDLEEKESEEQTAEQGKNGDSKEEANLIASSTIIETIEDSYSQEDFVIGIILVGIVVVLILIIMFFIVLLK